MESKENIQAGQNNNDNLEENKTNVENSNDEHIDQDFPGYPHYPPKEDIMDQRTDAHRVDVDVENFAAGQNASGINERYARNKDQQEDRNASREDKQSSGNNNK
jgi:hypothetical protein